MPREGGEEGEFYGKNGKLLFVLLVFLFFSSLFFFHSVFISEKSQMTRGLLVNL